MNEEDLRLLQAAAAGSTVASDTDAPNASVVVDDESMEQAVADLSADEIDAVLQAMAGEMEEKHGSQSQDFPQPPQPPQPAHPARVISGANTTSNTKFHFETTDDLKRLLGLDDSPNPLIIDGVLTQQNGNIVAGGMDDQSSAIDHEGHLADLQRSVVELSNPTARTNSSPLLPAAALAAAQSAANLMGWLSANNSSANITPAPSTPAPPPSQPRSRARQYSISNPSEDPLKAAERDRVRVENRERKKKWRTQNQERNKDNDLRCRVTKRAAQLYGNATTSEKTHWIEREFNRRRSRRVIRKEQRIIDNPAANNPSAGSSSVFPAFNNFNPSSSSSNSPINVKKGDYVYDENFSRREDLVDVMHILAALSGEPGMLAELMSLAVANGFDEQALQAQCGRLSPDGSSCGGDEGRESQDLIEIPENVLAGSLNTWTPETSITPMSFETPQVPQPVVVDLLGAEESKCVEQGAGAGAVTLVPTRNTGLSKHSENNERSGDQEVKPEPQSPNQSTTDPWASGRTRKLDELGLDNVPEESLDSAIEELLRSQAEEQNGPANATGDGEVEFDAEIQRLLQVGGQEVVSLLQSMRTVEPTETQAGMPTDDFSMGDDNRIELAQQVQHSLTPGLGGQLRDEPAGPMMDADELPVPEGLSLDEINNLLAHFTGSEPVQIEPTHTPHQQAVSAPSPVEPFFNPDPDTSALYTKDTIVAIFKAILELSPVPSQSQKCGTKRSSPTSYDDTPTKRHRGHTPINLNLSMKTATVSAITQLSGLLGNGYMQHSPPPTLPVQTQAYVASFGTTDGMNKRLMAMKPPPYRPNGSGLNGGGVGAGVTGIQVKRKTGDDKKVRAMGFPPLMAGMGRKV